MIANLEGTHLKESVESTPPANRHSHHPTMHRGALLDGERLTVPASSSRLSELELRSWEKEEQGGGSCSARAREGGGGQNKTKTHLKVTLVPSVWAAGPGRDSAGLKKLLCYVYLWLLMVTGSNLWEPLWSNHVKHRDGDEDKMRDYTRHTHMHASIHSSPSRPRLMAGLLLSSTY